MGKFHRYGRKLPLLLSCLGMSLTYAGYGILVTIDPKHKWVTTDPKHKWDTTDPKHKWFTTDPKHKYFLWSWSLPRLPSYYYMLPSLGISLGGQFFVFFQVYCLHTECVEKKRSPNLVKIYLGYIQESANKKLFLSMPDVLCLHQWLLRQSARRKSKVHKVKKC